MEKTFIMVKPDGVQRQLIGDILSRFERKGLQLAGAKLMRVTEQMAEKHYAEHQGKPFFGELVEFITSGPVFAMVWEGENVIEVTRQLIGKTNPKEALLVRFGEIMACLSGKTSSTALILSKVQNARLTFSLRMKN